MKRKFEFEDASPTNCKQQKLVPFPRYGSDDDSDSMMTEAEPFYTHSRISSNASTASSDTSGSPAASPYVYPAFDIYPMQDVPMIQADELAPSSPQNPSSPVGLLQPHSSFQHHGANCSQIPKLRIACAPGLNGQRTMWSFCEQCGSISMVNQD
ncbi:hypothetical protein WG66_006345 [Moniliophthora roreri]|uniref:Uncharacterized protein n=1 Tax=Moniliophthora roreri TaxID=221103 RepID=A0A0W0FFY7_MONRR|nr:hypothetical protein WG66_006345 [Moniliophthora roreri]